MASDKNHDIVNKTKQLLKEHGYEVKTSHIYNILAKLADEPSWNVAKTKGIDFVNLINTKFSGLAPEDVLATIYLDLIKNKTSKDQLFFGFSRSTKEPIFTHIFEEKNNANCLFVGAMGSGKTVSSKIMITHWMKHNASQSQLFIIDGLKGAGDFPAFFAKNNKGDKNFPQVSTALDSKIKIINSIDLLWEEYQARVELLTKYNKTSINELDKSNPNNRIMVLLEEFHYILQITNFNTEYLKHLTTANKLYTLLQKAKKIGFIFVACSQKATSTDIHPDLLAHFHNKFVFKTSPSESHYIVKSDRASAITDKDKGLCLNAEFGFIQWPVVYNKLDELIKESITPSIGKFSFLTLPMIDEVLETDSLRSMYRTKSLKQLITNINNYDPNTIITALHEKFNHKNIEELNKNDLNNKSNISHLITLHDQLKIVVMTRLLSGHKIVAKHLDELSETMVVNQCSRGIIYALKNNLPKSLYDIAKIRNIEIVDGEDLLKIITALESR